VPEPSESTGTALRQFDKKKMSVIQAAAKAPATQRLVRELIA